MLGDFIMRTLRKDYTKNINDALYMTKKPVMPAQAGNHLWFGTEINIECLFGCFKGRGFNFEDTHITDKTRIKKMKPYIPV